MANPRDVANRNKMTRAFPPLIDATASSTSQRRTGPPPKAPPAKAPPALVHDGPAGRSMQDWLSPQPATIVDTQANSGYSPQMLMPELLPQPACVKPWMQQQPPAAPCAVVDCRLSSSNPPQTVTHSPLVGVAIVGGAHGWSLADAGDPSTIAGPSASVVSDGVLTFEIQNRREKALKEKAANDAIKQNWDQLDQTACPTPISTATRMIPYPAALTTSRSSVNASWDYWRPSVSTMPPYKAPPSQPPARVHAIVQGSLHTQSFMTRDEPALAHCIACSGSGHRNPLFANPRVAITHLQTQSFHRDGRQWDAWLCHAGLDSYARVGWFMLAQSGESGYRHAIGMLKGINNSIDGTGHRKDSTSRWVCSEVTAWFKQHNDYDRQR